MRRKMCIYKCMLNVYKNQQNRQTGSRNLMGPKTLPVVILDFFTVRTKNCERPSTFLYPRSPKGEGILFYLCPSVAFFSVTVDIWSQASYRYTILWVAFLDPSDSYFLFADLVGFYTQFFVFGFNSKGTQNRLIIGQDFFFRGICRFAKLIVNT
jgi:hypothetical protein